MTLDPGTARYLGDGLYATNERGLLTLFTHNGLGVTNVVYLEPEVLHAFQYFVAERRPTD